MPRRALPLFTSSLNSMVKGGKGVQWVCFQGLRSGCGAGSLQGPRTMSWHVWGVTKRRFLVPAPPAPVHAYRAENTLLNDPATRFSHAGDQADMHKLLCSTTTRSHSFCELAT